MVAGTGSWPEGNVVPAQEVELAKIFPPARPHLLKVPSLTDGSSCGQVFTHVGLGGLLTFKHNNRNYKEQNPKQGTSR